MKTSIFDMTFTLPPMVEMTEVEKEMPMGTNSCACWGPVSVCIVRRPT
jgi:hypothetical protein